MHNMHKALHLILSIDCKANKPRINNPKELKTSNSQEDNSHSGSIEICMDVFTVTNSKGKTALIPKTLGGIYRSLTGKNGSGHYICMEPLFY